MRPITDGERAFRQFEERALKGRKEFMEIVNVLALDGLYEVYEEVCERLKHADTMGYIDVTILAMALQAIEDSMLRLGRAMYNKPGDSGETQ